MIHRDLKPENILLDDENGLLHVYLADFAMSRSAYLLCYETNVRSPILQE